MAKPKKEYMSDSDRIIKKREDNIIDWISYYRENPARLAVEYFGIQILTKWQQAILHMMFISVNIVWIASRGLGKTYLSVLFCIIKAVLYPGSQIVFTSRTQAQALKVMIQKLNEFMRDYPNIACEIEKFEMGTDPKILFFNGSIIWIVSPSDSSLGLRANVVLVDEYRKVKNDIIKTVFIKFLTRPRTLPFKTMKDSEGNLLFQDYPYEKNIQIYISSQAPTYEEAYLRYLNTIKSMFYLEGYFAICLPYYLGVKDGVITKDQIIQELKEEGADLSVFALEYECIPFGASSNAYFTDEMFKFNRNIHKIFIPMTSNDYLKYRGDLTKNPFYIPKENGEKRILAVDTASTNNSNSANTIVECIRLIPKIYQSKNNGESVYYYEKQIVYIKNIVGDMNHTAQAKVIKRIFYLFEANTLVIDGNGTSMGVMHQLILPCYDEEYNLYYKAFDTFNDVGLNNMCREPEEERETVVYSVKVAGASSYEIEHKYNTYTRSELVSRHIKLPSNESDGESYLARYHKYDEQTPETQAEWLSTYIQCDALIAEALNLEKKMVDGGTKVRLEMAKRSTIKRRDRIIALQYGMLYVQELEIEDFKNKITFDYTKYNLGVRGRNNDRTNPFSDRLSKVRGFGWNRRK